MIGAKVGEATDCERVGSIGAAEGMAFSARRQFMRDVPSGQQVFNRLRIIIRPSTDDS